MQLFEIAQAVNGNTSAMKCSEKHTKKQTAATK